MPGYKKLIHRIIPKSTLDAVINEMKEADSSYEPLSTHHYKTMWLLYMNTDINIYVDDDDLEIDGYKVMLLTYTAYSLVGDHTGYYLPLSQMDVAQFREDVLRLINQYNPVLKVYKSRYYDMRWEKISGKKNLTREFISENRYKLDFGKIFENYDLDLNFIEEIIEDVDTNYRAWRAISKKKNLTQDFIWKYKDKLDLYYIFQNSNLDSSFMEKLVKYVSEKVDGFISADMVMSIVKNKSVTEDIINKYILVNDYPSLENELWEELLNNKNLVLSEGFILEHIDNLNKELLYENYKLDINFLSEIMTYNEYEEEWEALFKCQQLPLDILTSALELIKQDGSIYLDDMLRLIKSYQKSIKNPKQYKILLQSIDYEDDD